MVEQIIGMLIIVALGLVLSWRPHLNTATFFEVIGLVLGYDGRPGSRRTRARRPGTSRRSRSSSPESPRGHDLSLHLRADAHPRRAPRPEPQACEPRQGEDTHRDRVVRVLREIGFHVRSASDLAVQHSQQAVEDASATDAKPVVLVLVGCPQP